MTPYHFDNQQKKKTLSRAKKLWVALGVLIAVILVIFLAKLVLQRVMQGPVWLAESLGTETGIVAATFTPKSQLLARIRELEEQVEQEATNRILLQAITYDYNALRTEVGYLPENNTAIIARVIGKPNRSLFNSIILDQGMRQGVVVGNLVTAHGTIALGRVSDASETTATVVLFSSPTFSGDVIIQNKESITIPAQGKGSGNFEIHIPREIEVTEGDLIALPEDPTRTIGVVKSIQFDPRDPFQTILARTPVNVQELQFVEVVQ